MRAPEFQLKRAAQPLTGAWRDLPVAGRGSTLLGISFRPLQAASFGLDVLLDNLIHGLGVKTTRQQKEEHNPSEQFAHSSLLESRDSGELTTESARCPADR